LNRQRLGNVEQQNLGFDVPELAVKQYERNDIQITIIDLIRGRREPVSIQSLSECSLRFRDWAFQKKALALSPYSLSA
jgi:hypothetical protein